MEILADLRGSNPDLDPRLLDVRRDNNPASADCHGDWGAVSLPGLPTVLPRAARECESVCSDSRFSGSAVRERLSHYERRLQDYGVLYQATVGDRSAGADCSVFPRERREYRT